MITQAHNLESAELQFSGLLVFDGGQVVENALCVEVISRILRFGIYKCAFISLRALRWDETHSIGIEIHEIN